MVGPAHFEPDEPARVLFEGMKGLGTDEQAVLEVVASHTNAQRQQIQFKYDVLYRKNLIKELDSELGGHFSKVVLALMCEPEEYLLRVLHHCITKSRGGKLFKKFQKLTGKKGLAPEAYLMLGILWGRPNRELAQMKEAYKKGIICSDLHHCTFSVVVAWLSHWLGKNGQGELWGQCQTRVSLKQLQTSRKYKSCQYLDLNICKPH